MNNIQGNKLSKNYFVMEDKTNYNDNEPNNNKYNNKTNFNQNNININFLNKNIMYNNKYNNSNNDGNSNSYDINNNINSLEKNNDNIFGLNFHQDEDEDNQFVNSLHFSKFGQNKNSNINFDEFVNDNDNYNHLNNISKLNNYNTNNYEQKIKNNRNMITNNMKNSLIIEDEPYQISMSKYTESINENYSAFYNSKMNKNNNKITNNKKNIYNNKFSKRLSDGGELDFYTKEYKLNDSKENNQLYNNTNININRNNSKNNILYNQKKKINYKNKEISKKNSEQNNLKNNLLLNNNKNDNLPPKNNIKKPSHIPHNKSFSSNRTIIKDKIYNNNLDENNYFKITNNKRIKNNNNYLTENNSNINKNNLSKINYTNRTNNMNVNKIHNFNILEYNIIKEENFKKIYSKKQKAELDMVRGCFLFDKKYFNFDIKNGSTTINYIKFIKPTEPLIQINYRNIDKFYPLIRKKFTYELTNNINDNNNIYKNNTSNNIRKFKTLINKNTHQFSNNFSPYEINNENNNNNYNNELMKKKKKIPFPKNNFPSCEDNIKTNININNNLSKKENNNPNYNQLDEYGLSFQFKKKIYDWLIDIDIIKDKVIKVEYLPTLCINGVLLCDLVNRCEGKNEIIKGIIRRTSTRSHIQVNINKVLEYLRTIEKFPSRHLWDNLEISKGNNLIIWELLDDIYNFYGNKKTFKRKMKKNNSINNLNKTFTLEKNNDKILDKENLEKINYYSNTPLKQTKFHSLNVNKKDKNKSKTNNYDISPILPIKKSNNYKCSYTPTISKINNKKPIDKNSLNYEPNKNNFYFNENNININDNLNNYKNVNNINYINNGTESSKRNNLNHTNDNFYESKMFSVDNSNDNINNRSKKSNKDNTFRKNLDISSLYSDRFFNVEKSNKSFSVNNGIYSKKRRSKNNINNNGNYSRYNIKSNNQSFYSTNIDNNRTRNKGCFLLFEKASINKLKEKLGALNKYNTNEIDTLDIKDI